MCVACVQQYLTSKYRGFDICMSVVAVGFLCCVEGGCFKFVGNIAG